jgi:sarcosine oxidase subunit gamma
MILSAMAMSSSKSVRPFSSIRKECVSMAEAAKAGGAWAPRGAWAGIASPGHVGAPGKAGVTARLLDGFGLASLIVAPGDMAALTKMAESRLGATLPQTPKIVTGAACEAIWSGPGQWLLRTPSREGVAALMPLSAHGALSDQSDGRAAVRVSGPRVRDMLAKGVMLDLHPEAFAVGDAALTGIAHVGVHLWRLPDGPEGAVFEIMAPRSMAGSFWSWFAASVAEFGCQVTAGRG